MLDIDCRTGWFLENAIANDFNAARVEFSEKLAELTSERLKINVFSKPLETLDGLGKYDVIEHVINPREVIKGN